MTELSVPDPDAHLPHEPKPGQGGPGWRPDFSNPHLERWWTGRRWYGDPRPRTLQGSVQQPYPPGVAPQSFYGHPGQPTVYVQQVNTAPRHVSGLSNGQRMMHIVLTVCTLGLWAPIWILSEWMGRKRIG